MPKRPSPYPTEAELEVLSILWEKGPSTVRQVHEVVLTRRETSLTTTLKTLQVMRGKQLVKRGREKPQRYRAAVAEEKTQAGMLQDLLAKAFDGSVRKLMQRLVKGGVSEKELDEIATLIEAARKEQRGIEGGKQGGLQSGQQSGQ